MPAIDSVVNLLERDVIGNKADTANAVVGVTSSQMRYIKAILNQVNKLGGAAAPAAGVVANWHTGAATSGLPGADLVVIGAAGVRNKIQSLLVNISAFHLAPAPAASVTVRAYQLVNGVERIVYNQTVLRGTDPDGLWVINGTVGIHQAVRIEIYSDNVADDAINCDYDYMLEAM